MNGKSHIESLLKQVTEIRLRYEEETRRTGENWNVFYAFQFLYAMADGT